MGTGQGPPTWIEPTHQGPGQLPPPTHPGTGLTPHRLASNPDLLRPHLWLRCPLPKAQTAPDPGSLPLGPSLPACSLKVKRGGEMHPNLPRFPVFYPIF